MRIIGHQTVPGTGSLRLLVVAFAVAVFALTGWPSGSAYAAPRNDCKPVFSQLGGLSFYDGHVRVVGGLSCRTARRTLKAFARKRVRDFEGCAVAVASNSVCVVGRFECSDVFCRESADHSRGVKFREIQEQHS